MVLDQVLDELFHPLVGKFHPQVDAEAIRRLCVVLLLLNTQLRFAFRFRLLVLVLLGLGGRLLSSVFGERAVGFLVNHGVLARICVKFHLLHHEVKLLVHVRTLFKFLRKARLFVLAADFVFRFALLTLVHSARDDQLLDRVLFFLSYGLAVYEDLRSAVGLEFYLGPVYF